MKKKFIKIFIIVLLLTLFSCSGDRKYAYFYNIKNYYMIYDKEFDLYSTVKKNLLRKYINLKEIKVNTFSALSNELAGIDNYENEGFIFLQDKISSLLIKSGEIQFDKDKFKLITYNIPEDDFFYQSKIRTYNVLIDPELITNELINILKKHSKDEDNLSDCGIVINPDYYYSKSTLNHINEKMLEPDIIQIQGNDKRLDEWLYSKQRTVLVFFGYNANEILLNLNKSKLGKPVIIEVLTGYYKASDFVAYNISLNWENAFLYALNSSSFEKFLDDNLEFNEKGIFTNTLDKWFLVKTVKIKAKIKIPEFLPLPLEPEETNDRKKEE